MFKRRWSTRREFFWIDLIVVAFFVLMGTSIAVAQLSENVTVSAVVIPDAVLVQQNSTIEADPETQLVNDLSDITVHVTDGFKDIPGWSVTLSAQTPNGEVFTQPAVSDSNGESLGDVTSPTTQIVRVRATVEWPGYVAPILIDDYVDVAFLTNFDPEIEFTYYPEKRVGGLGNYQAPVIIEVYDPTTKAQLFEGVATTDGSGEGVIELTGITAGDTYQITAKGQVHLRLPYIEQVVDALVAAAFDFSAGGSVFAKSGDTHISSDNEVNALDLSTSLLQLNTSDNLTDLNQDGFVNALDLSAQLINLYEVGYDMQ